jgi:antirestriction protein ArdC
MSEKKGQPEQTEDKETRKPRDLRQEITDKFLEALDQGKIPWEKPWESLEYGMPRNMATGREYNGANSLILMMEQNARGYKDPRFGTFRQIGELGGKVTKGEKGIPIEFCGKEPFYHRRDTTVRYLDRAYKVFSEEKDIVHIGGFKDSTSTLAIRPTELRVHHQDKILAWDEAHRTLDRFVARAYVVFNVEQCTGLETIPPLALPDHKIPTSQRAEQIMEAMKKDGLGFAEHPQHAFYSPSRDEVSLPPRENFKSVEGYYGTALHEIGHATGAAQRLNRDGITGGHRFGSEGYAREELRAEIFSAFMAVQTGVPHDMTQHQAYVQSWADVLRKDKHEIFRAASEAEKAVDYVLAREQELQIGQTRESDRGQIRDARREKFFGVRDTEHAHIEGTLVDISHKARELFVREPDGEVTVVRSPDGLSLANYRGLFGAGESDGFEGAVEAATTLRGKNIVLTANDSRTATLEANGKMIGRGVVDKSPVPFLSREPFVLKSGEPGVNGKILELFDISDASNPQHIIAAELQTDKGIVLAHRHDYQPMSELLGMKGRHAELAVGNDGRLQIQQAEKEHVPMPQPVTHRYTHNNDLDLGR